MMTISAIPDLGHMIMRRGMGGIAKYMVNFATMSDAVKAQNDVARSAASAIDLMTNERAKRLFLNDTIDPLTKTTAWENKRDKAVDIFAKTTGMPYWNSGLKTMTGAMYSDEVLKQAIKAADGTLSKKNMATFAQNGLGIDDLKAIAKEFKAQSGKNTIDGTHLADINQWQDKQLAQRFQTAIMTEVDKTIVTPGKGDLPLVSHSFAGKLILQFKSFAMAANNRVLLATLDDMSYQKVYGAVSMVGLGAMSYIIRETLKGNEPDMSMEKLTTEGFERSGLLAFWSDPNSLVEKATAGKVHASAALEGFDWWDEAGMSSKYASRNMRGAVLGVNAGLIQDIGKITGAMASGEWAESDIRAIRRAILFNNVHVLHQGFSRMEDKIGEGLK